jgi:hypothetical protein
MEWQPIETAPKDGRAIVVFRPLAHLTRDEVVRIVNTRPDNQYCWEATVPDGDEPWNYTDGLCHCSHWMPIPDPPISR